MPINPEQKVFPFLAEDPLYQAAVDRERVVHEMLERVGSGLEDDIAGILWERIGPLIEKRINDRVQEILAQRVKEAHRSLNCTVQDILCAVDNHLTEHRQKEESDDWWRRGDPPPGSCDDEDHLD